MNAQVLRGNSFSTARAIIKDWWHSEGGKEGGAATLLFISNYSRENTAILLRTASCEEQQTAFSLTGRSDDLDGAPSAHESVFK